MQLVLQKQLPDQPFLSFLAAIQIHVAELAGKSCLQTKYLSM